MTRHTVLTAVGRDRPGLVEEVSEFLLERGGSIEESRMANLLGQFAIVMLVTGGDADIEAIVRDGAVLADQTGIDARFTPVEPPAASRSASTHRLVAQALDQPGLVHRVADVLRRFDVNIETLETTLESAPITGTPVFAMSIVLAVPDEVGIAEVEQELERVCEPLNITWELAPVEPAPLGAGL
jgi:glycine cleavage system transcriptional repressor